jgi:hypothetical protein
MHQGKRMAATLRNRSRIAWGIYFYFSPALFGGGLPHAFRAAKGLAGLYSLLSELEGSISYVVVCD